MIRLASTKCTIGSDVGCTLRLRAPGVDPLHCLILRGPRQTVIRRWSAATRLNDREFVDAPLNVGDRLGIGPLELEVVQGTESRLKPLRICAPADSRPNCRSSL